MIDFLPYLENFNHLENIHISFSPIIYVISWWTTLTKHKKINKTKSKTQNEIIQNKAKQKNLNKRNIKTGKIDKFQLMLHVTLILIYIHVFSVNVTCDIRWTSEMKQCESGYGTRQDEPIIKMNH